MDEVDAGILCDDIAAATRKPANEIVTAFEAPDGPSPDGPSPSLSLLRFLRPFPGRGRHRRLQHQGEGYLGGDHDCEGELPGRATTTFGPMLTRSR